jgi:hypothetical protein
VRRGASQPAGNALVDPTLIERLIIFRFDSSDNVVIRVSNLKLVNPNNCSCHRLRKLAIGSLGLAVQVSSGGQININRFASPSEDEPLR